jgi:hypothetical protein
MLIKLKLKKLYGKEQVSIEELLSNRAGLSILPYEIAVNEAFDDEKIKSKIPKEILNKAYLIYSNYSYLINRKKSLPKVKGKINNEEIRKIFEVLRSIE